MKKETVKGILALQRRSLALTGSLTFKGKEISDLADVGVQQHMQTLDISETQVATLKNLPSQKLLTKIIADSSLLENYEGFSRFKRLKSFSAINTPIAARPNFRLACAVLFGPKLETVNGVKLTPEERHRASTYPPFAEHLIEDGWDIVEPAPSPDELRQIAIRRKLQIPGCDVEFVNEMSQSLLRVAKSVHVSDSRAKTARSGGDDAKLVEALLKELRKIGLQVNDDGNVKERLVEVIQELASAATILTEYKKEIQGVGDDDDDA